MTTREELNLLLRIIHKYNLPLSPILEYAVNEKKEENEYAENRQEEIQNISTTFIDDGYVQINNSFSVEDIEIPEDADITTRNKYLLQFCYGIFSKFEEVLNDREKDICKMLLVKNSRKKAAEEYRITEERVRQIYLKCIKKISHAYKSTPQKIDKLKQEIEELKRRNYILEKALADSSSLEKVQSLQGLEDRLCNNAKRLLGLRCEYLPFSKRTLNVLTTANIEFFREIPQLSIERVLKFRNCGKKTRTELREFLYKYSLEFGLTYNEVVSRLVKYYDDDFDNSLFSNHNERNRQKRQEKASRRDESIVGTQNQYEINSDFEELEIEQVFVNSTGEIIGSTNLPICPENRSGKPWSSEEEKTISDYYANGHSFFAIAKAIGRTEIAVMSRLGQMGVIDYTYVKQQITKEETRID